MTTHGIVTLSRYKVLASVASALAASVIAGPAIAQLSKLGARSIVVPLAAGGGVDVFARLLAEQLRQQTGLSIIIENRPGANGAIGGNSVRLADADGATLLLSAATHVMAREVMKSALYDPIDDFASVARVCEVPMMLVISPMIAANNVSELLAEIRKAPKKMDLRRPSIGSPGRLAELEFNRLAKLNVIVQAYRGTAPALKRRRRRSYPDAH